MTTRNEERLWTLLWAGVTGFFIGFGVAWMVFP